MRRKDWKIESDGEMCLGLLLAVLGSMLGVLFVLHGAC
mgnify:CR=1 FL=1